MTIELDQRELWALLEEPAMQAKMEAAGTSPAFIGIAEHTPESPSDPPHDALWALILEERPEWRPWYERMREVAATAFAVIRPENRLADGPTYTTEEVWRMLFGGPPES